MIFLHITVKVTPKKKIEFEQTMESLMNDLRMERGCLAYNICRDFNDSNMFYIVNKWKEKRDLVNHIQTNLHKILMGAISNLCDESLIDISLTATAADLHKIEQALKKQLSNTIPIASEAEIK